MRKLLVLVLVCIAFCSCESNTKVYHGQEALDMYMIVVLGKEDAMLVDETSAICVYVDRFTATKYQFTAVYKNGETALSTSTVTMKVTKNVDVNEELVKCKAMERDFYKEGYIEGKSIETKTNNSHSENYALYSESQLIKEHGVDIFRIGKQIPFNTENYTIKKEIVTFEEAIEEPIYEVFENRQKIFSISPEYDYDREQFTDKIGDIIVYSGKFRTAEGIGVGSSIEDFVRTYPDFIVWWTYISDRYVLDTKQYRHFQFELDGEDYLKEVEINGDMTVLNLSDFKKGSKIKKIRIY